MRIEKAHKMLPAVKRGASITVSVDGQPLPAYQGETIAAVLHAAGRRAYRYSPRADNLPGFFCGMGICYGCSVLVNGFLKRACVTKVVADMEIATRPEASE